MSVGSRIKELRENRKLTRNEFAELLGVTVGAISNYENEVSSPKEPILFKIMETLKCDANYLFQDAVEMPIMKNQVSIEEYKAIEKYRSLDSFGQETVTMTLDRELCRTKTISEQKKQIQTQANRINELTANLSDFTTLRLYTYLQKLASAGTGFYFDDIPTDTIEAPYCKGADFIIGVNGDSMEPDYHDGDKLYIQKAKNLSIGDVGIFTVWNECFVKELGERGLISRNPAYDDIPGSEDVRLIGRVLGKVEDN